MKYRTAIVIGTSLSLVYDVFQIAMSYDNKILFSIGIAGFFVAIYGLQQNLTSHEEFKLCWIKFYIIPIFIMVLAQISLIDDMYVKGFSVAGVQIDKYLPGQTVDYLLSLEVTVISYALPLIMATILFFANVVVVLVNTLVCEIEKRLL